MLLFCWSCSSGDKNEPTPEPSPEIVISSTQKVPVMETKGGTVNITFSTTASWTASVVNTRSDNWCIISPTSGGAGTVALTITATENLTPDERNATVTLRAGTASKTLTITQKQKDALTLTSSKIEVAAIGGEIGIEVKANIPFDYEIEESSKPWITSASTRGLTATALKFRVAENTDLEKREGYIIVRSGEFTEKVTVYQEGSAASIVLTQNEYTVGSEGETIKVELKSNTDYEVQLPREDWITEVTTKAYSSHTHYFTVAKNETNDARGAEILFTDKENGVTEKVKISQAQLDGIIVTQSSYNIDETGGVVEVEIASNIDYETSIDSDWIKEVAKTRGLIGQKLSFTVAAMPEGVSRTGKIDFTNKAANIVETVTIQQQRHLYFKEASVELVETKPMKLTYASVSPDENLIWESSDTNVASVTQEGIVTGVNKGVAVITVATKDGKYKASCEVSVKAITDYLSFSVSSSIISVGGWINKSVSSTIKNNSEYDITLLSLTILHPVTNIVISKTTDSSLLGILQAGGERTLGVNGLREDITPKFVWEYTFGGNRYANLEKIGGAGTGNPGASGEDMPWQ